MHYYSSTGSQLTDAVTPSDTVDLGTSARWLYVLVAWNLRFNTPSSWSDTAVTTHNATALAAWVTIPCIVTRVHSTGTTATVCALY